MVAVSEAQSDSVQADLLRRYGSGCRRTRSQVGCRAVTVLALVGPDVLAWVVAVAVPTHKTG